MTSKLRTDEFNYYLPEQFIAQEPVEKRDQSRLMVLNRQAEKIEHHHFYEITDYFSKGDVLIVNETKVIPARLTAVRSTGAHVEIFLIQERTDKCWEVLVKPGRKVRVGETLKFKDSIVQAYIKERTSTGGRIIEFLNIDRFSDWLETYGQVPLPPYIRRTEEDKDKERYQTVFAKKDGAVAAPTAGLHFTDQLLEKLKNIGVNIAPLILHVGLGTFRPVQSELIIDHKMDAEFFALDENTARLINNARQGNHKIVATGTTSVRALESADVINGMIQPTSKWTNIFIYPPYQFKWVDAMITNFHLPQSTLLMLVSAFAGKSLIMNAYQQAIENNYRFYSYGDAMFIY